MAIKYSLITRHARAFVVPASFALSLNLEAPPSDRETSIPHRVDHLEEPPF